MALREGEPVTSALIRGRRKLLFSNSSDAASRSISDFVIDIIFVSTLGASAFDMGVLNALGSVAFIFASIPAGQLVDKYLPTTVLRVGLSAKLVLLILVMSLVFTNLLTIPLGFFLSALLGMCNVFTETSQIAAVPQLSNKDSENREGSITSLIAKLTAADQTLAIIIPAIMGVVLDVIGAPTLLALSSALLLSSILFANSIKKFGSPNNDVSEINSSVKSEKKGALEGLRFIRANRTLLALTALVSFSNAGLAVGSAVEALFIIKYLDLGPQWYGLLTAIGGIGGVVGAVIAPRITSRYTSQSITVATAFLQILGSSLMLTSAFTPSLTSIILIIAHNLLWGIVVIAFNISTMSWVTSITPEALLGRVTSGRRMFTFGAVPLGSLLGGMLGSLWGIPAALVAWCALIATGLLAYYLLIRSDSGKAGANPEQIS